MDLLQDFAVVLVFAGAAGLLFRRCGLSAIVGYLVAGMIIGPYTPPFSLVENKDSVEQLSQFGLVFLMFFVGLELSLARIRTLGFSLVWATALLAWLVFNLCQCFAWLMGWSQVASFVFASMFVVSSSAIISKMLLESRLSHERYAQNALGITILEDVVVIILMTLLSSQIQLAGLAGHGDLASGPARTLGLFAGFVVLTVVVGVLFLPKILQRFDRSGDMDLKIIIVGGMVFAAAVVTGRVGFSSALGAFLFGVIVSGTSFKHKIEKSLVGTQDLFSAVFFASIGMMIDLRTVHQHLWLVLGVTAFIVPARILAGAVSFLLTGSDLKTAVRTALILTPIGEFSYILAQQGVNAGVGVPDYFYVIAVGTSILTSILAPLLVRHSEKIAECVAGRLPRFLQKFLGAYQFWLREMTHKQEQIVWWKLTASRLGQLSVEVLLLAGVLMYSATLQHGLRQLLERAALDFSFSPYLYWTVVGVAVLALIVAIWRNIGALGAIYADTCAGHGQQARRLRQVIELAIQTVGAVGLLWLVWALFPVPLAGPWTGGAVAVIAVVFAALFWRRLIQWHSQFQYSLNRALTGAAPSLSSTVTPRQSEFWRVQLAECVLPDHAACRLRTIAALGLRPRFGCAIVEIERHGEIITNPPPDTLLFAGDKLLLFGADRQIKPALDFLQTEEEPAGRQASISESKLTTVDLPPDSPKLGRSLADLGIFAQTGVQVLGVERDGQAILNPAAGQQLKAGDKLLVLGTAEQGKKFRRWLSEPGQAG
ncbi:MAG: cation:proton antiporter [Verrucomicrobiales bacterium]|jgi:CPA2 family monovalent cation:H+ antiporter-2|nr:cation:proton antiporter [Verrucomicrobiales bacterium]